MGKCVLNVDQGVKYLMANGKSITTSNLYEVMARGASEYIDGLEYLDDYAKTEEGAADVRVFMNQSLGEYLRRVASFPSIRKGTRMAIEDILTDTEEMTSFITDWHDIVASENSESVSGITPEPEYGDVMNFEERARVTLEDVTETDGADSENGTGAYPDSVYKDLGLGYELEMFRKGDDKDTIFDVIGSNVPANRKVKSELALLEDEFTNIKAYYTSGFLMMVNSVFVGKFVSHIQNVATGELTSADADAIVTEAKKEFQVIASSIPYSETKVKDGQGTAQERQAYFADVALRNIETILYNNVRYITANKKGEFEMNIKNIRGRTSYVANAGAVDGYQVSDMIDGFIAATELLVPIEETEVDGEVITVYEIDPDAPLLSKDNIIFLSQYLQTFTADYIKNNKKLPTLNVLRDEFSEVPTETDSDGYRMLHSLVLKFFTDKKYVIKDNELDTLTQHSGLYSTHGKNLGTKQIMDNIRNSMSSQLKSTGTNAKSVIIQGVTSIKSGLKTSEMIFLESALAESLVDVRLKGRYKISSDTLSIVKAAQDSPHEYSINLKLSRNTSLNFTFNGNLSKTNNSKGIQPTQDTLNSIRKLFANNKGLLKKAMVALKLPYQMSTMEFLVKYGSKTTGESVPDEAKFEYFFSNLVFMLAMNIPSNKALLTEINSNILPTADKISAIYSSVIQDGNNDRSTEAAEGIGLEFNPFTAIYTATSLIDETLVSVYGKSSSSLFRDVGSGWEYGVTPLSAAQQINENIERAKIFNLPSAVGVEGYKVSSKLAVITRGSSRDGKVVKSVENFTAEEHLNSIINGPFLGMLLQSNGFEAAFGTGSATDTSRPQHTVMESADGFIIPDNDEAKDRVKAKAVTYHMDYYKEVREITLQNWREFLANTGFRSYSQAVIDQNTRSLKVLSEFLIGEQIPYEEVSPYMVNQMDFVKYGNNVTIKPEYIYFAEDIFGQGKFSKGLKFLNDKFDKFRGINADGKRANTNTAYSKLRINNSNKQFIADTLGRKTISNGKAKAIAGFSYFWHEAMFKNMFRRATVGDVLNFKGSIDRSNTEEQFARLESIKEYETLSFTDKQIKLEEILRDQSLSAMMVDQAKRASSVATGSMRPELKAFDEIGSYLQNHDPSKPGPIEDKGGILSVTFEEIPDSSRDILGAMKDAGLGDIYDGAQWGHPLFFLQFNQGIVDSHRTLNGSALKPTGMENNGYISRLQKNSVQDTLTYENQKKSEVVRWLLKMANTRVTFNNGQPVTLLLPKMIMVNGATKIVIGDNGPELESVEVTSMHDIYSHFGAELGGNVYSGMSSWEFIHTYILSGEDYPDGQNAGITPEMTNKYIGIIGTTASQKMGNRNVNSVDKFSSTTANSQISIDVIDPYNYGSILNASEDINTSDDEESSHVKVSTQIMRSIKLGGNNMHEADVVHMTKAMLTNLGYRQLVDDKIETLAVGFLIEQANPDNENTVLDQMVVESTQTLLEEASNRPTGLTEADYDELMRLVDLGGDTLQYHATKRFFDEIVEQSLRYIDHEQTVLDGYKKGHLDLNSKQIKNIVTSAFYSEVSKATVKQAFKGSHAVLGPAHGIIPLFSVMSANGIEMTVTADEYSKSEHAVFRSIKGDIANNIPMLSLDTIVKYLDINGNEVVETIGEKAFRESKDQNIPMSVAVDNAITEMTDADTVEADIFTFKIPDINRKRDLQYSGYTRKIFNPQTKQVEIEHLRHPETGEIGETASIYTTDQYKQLQKLRKDKSDSIKAAKDGSLYTGNVDLDNEYRVSRPISTNKIFKGKTIAKAKKLAMDHIEALSGMVKEDALFKLNTGVYVYSDSKLVTYKSRYGVNYIDHTKYSEAKFNAYMSLKGRTDITYKQYLERTSVENDLNDAIYDTLIRAKQRESQELLNNKIHYADVMYVNGTEDTVEVKDVFSTEEKFQDVIDKLENGYYEVSGELISLNAGEDVATYELFTENLWNFDSTELIMSPHYKKEFFITDGTSIMDFIGKVDYSGISRSSTLMKYDRGISTGDFSEYQATPEYEHLQGLFATKIKKEIRNKLSKVIPTYVFRSGLITEFSIGSTPLTELFTTELKVIESHIKNNPEYEGVLNRRYKKALELKNEVEVLEKNSILGEGTQQNVIDSYIIELNAIQAEFVKNSSRDRALSWNASHEVFFTRIPSQDKQSYNRGRIISYAHQSSNTVLTPADLILISGADYDIDKLFNMVYHIDTQGRLKFFQAEGGMLDSNGNIDMEVFEVTVDAKLESYKRRISLSGIEQPQVFHNKMAKYRTKLYAQAQHMAHNHLLRSLMNIISDPKNFKQASTLIGVDSLERLLTTLNTSSDTFDPFDLVSDINLDVHGLSGKGMIGVVANALKNYSLIYNAANKTNLDVNKFAPKSYLDTYLVDIKDEVLDVLDEGNPELVQELAYNNEHELFSLILQEQIGVDEDGNAIYKPKVHTASIAADLEISTDAFHTEYESIQNFKRRLQIDPNAAIEESVLYLKELQSEEDFRIDSLKTNTETWELFSELLTAATDNAKLMIISQLGVDYTSLNIIHTLLTMGIGLDVAFDFISRPKIKRALKKVKDSVSVIGKPGKKPQRTSLRGIINSYTRRKRVNGYDKKKYKIVSMTKPFSTVDGISKFKKSFNADKDNAVLTRWAEAELTHEYTQLLNILDIQDSLTIIRSMAKATQGLDSDPFIMYTELKRIEYQINKRLAGYSLEQGAEETSQTGEAKFDIFKFFSDKVEDLKYRQDQIDLLGETSLPGYNFLEVIAQNADVFSYKVTQVKARARVDMVQRVDIAAEKVVSHMARSNKVNFFEEKSDYISYENIVDELIVSDFFEQRKEKYGAITMPGLDGQTFDLTSMEGRHDFLIAIEQFFEHIQNRANSDSEVDVNYVNNMFLNTLGLSSSTYNMDDDNAPKYFQSSDIRNFKIDEKSLVADGYKKLDGEDQRIFELYSLLVNKSTKSVKTFESFMDFAHLHEYNAHKTGILTSEDGFDNLLSKVTSTQLLLNSRTSVRTIRTKSFSQMHDEEGVVSSYEDKSTWMYMPPATPGENEFDDGVDLFRSDTSNQLYAATSMSKDLLKTTNGWFPIEKTMGYNSISYNTQEGTYFKGLKAILESGASPLSVTYKIAGSDNEAKGYVMGITQEGYYIILDENYKYDSVNSRYNDIITMRDLNPDMDFTGSYIGRKSLFQRSVAIDERELTAEKQNQSNIETIVSVRSGLLNKVVTSGVSKFASPSQIHGNVPIGQVIHTMPYKGGSFVFKYQGEQKVVDDGTYDQRDVQAYANHATKNNLYSIFSVEVVRDPNATAFLTPKDFNRGFADKVDTEVFQEIAPASAISGAVWGYSTFAAVPEMDAIGISNEKTLTVLKSKGRTSEFSREFFGTFTNTADIIEELRKWNYEIPEGGVEQEEFLLKLFNVDKHGKYSSPIKGLLQGTRESVNLYRLLPFNLPYQAYQRTAKVVENVPDLIIPEELDIYIESTLESSITNTHRTVSDTNINRSQINLIELGDDRTDVQTLALLKSVVADYNKIANTAEAIEVGDLKNHTYDLFTEGVDLTDKSIVILKVPLITSTLREIYRNDPKVSPDTYNGVPSQDRDAALQLSYFKKIVADYPLDIPLIVFNEAEQIFQQYDFETGTFMPVIHGIPDVGNSPLLFGFKTGVNNIADLDIIKSIVKYRAYSDAVFNLSEDVNNKKDQYLIDLAEDPDPEMVKLQSTNQGDGAVPAYTQLLGINGVIFYKEKLSTETKPPAGYRFVFTDESNQAVVEIRDKVIPVAGNFSTLEEGEPSPKFTVSTFAADGTILIQSSAPKYQGGPDVTVTYAIFPDEAQRVEEYGNFTGLTEVRNIRGSIVNPETGLPELFSIDKAFITTEDYMQRRNKNVEDRQKIYESKLDSRSIYVNEVQTIYRTMAKSTGFKMYVKEVGGTDALFKIISQNATGDLLTRFPSLGAVDAEGNSLLTQFRIAFEQYDQARKFTRELEKEHRAKLRDNRQAIEAPVMTKDPFVDPIDKDTETVLVFTDSNMTTDPAIQAEKAVLAERRRFRNHFTYTINQDKSLMGAALLNVFRSTKDGLVLADGGLSRMIKALRTIDRSSFESVYVPFPDLSTPIMEGSAIKYSDLADLMAKAFDEIGFIPKNMSFSESLASYITTNTGVFNISKIKMTRAITLVYDQTISNSVTLERYLPDRISMTADNTLLEVYNIHKGLDPATTDVNVKPREGSFLGKKALLSSSLKDAYKDWLRSNPGKFIELLNLTKYKSVLINKFNAPIQQLIEAMNELGFDMDVAAEITVDLGLTDVSQNGVTYKIVAEKDLTVNQVSVDKGTRVKTLIDNTTFVAEVVGKRTNLMKQTDGNVVLSDRKLLESMNIDDTIIDELLTAPANSVVIKVYRDPSANVVTASLDDIKNIPLGDVAAEELEAIGMEIDDMTRDVMNRGTFNLTFDITSVFGETGVAATGGNPFFNKVAGTSGNVLYTSGLTSDMVVSMVGSGMLDYITKANGENTKPYTENDTKNYFNLVAKKVIDKYIIPNNLGVAVGNRAGLEQQIRDYMLSQDNYGIDAKGDIVYKPGSTSIVGADQHLTLVTDSAMSINMNNAGITYNPLEGMITAALAVDSDDTTAKWIPAIVRSKLTKGRPNKYRYHGTLDSVGLHSIVRNPDLFMEDYNSISDSDIATIDTTRNNDFIKRVVTGIVTGRAKSKLTPEVTLMLSKIMDEDGNFLIRDSRTGELIPAHPMVKYAIGRSKYAALMLLRNNLEWDMDVSGITSFIKDAIDEDRYNNQFRSIYGGGKISVDELADISNTSSLTNFELMLYDITASSVSSLNGELVPSQNYFYSKLVKQGIGSFSTTMQNPAQDIPTNIQYVFNTGEIIEPGEIGAPKYNDALEVPYLSLNSSEELVKKFKSSLFWYIKRGSVGKYDMSDLGIQIEGVSDNADPLLLLTTVKTDIIREMYKDMGIEMDERGLRDVIDSGTFDHRLNTHLKFSVSGIGLLNSMFVKHPVKGLKEVDMDMPGEISKSSQLDKIGILIPGPTGLLYVTKDGAIYNVVASPVGELEFSLDTEKRIKLSGTINRNGDAAYSSAGDIYSSLIVGGQRVDDTVKLIQSVNTGKLIAESIATGDYYVFNNKSEGWSKVDLGSDTSEILFIAQQKPEHINKHTSQIVADGMLYDIKVESIKENVVKTMEGWTFTYDPSVDIYELTSTSDKKLPVGEKVSFQKTGIEYPNYLGYNMESMSVDNKTIRAVVQQLGSNLGIAVEMLSSTEILEEFDEEHAAARGFVSGDRIIVNSDLATLDTPIHEFGHVFFRNLRNTDYDAFLKLKGAALKSDMSAEIHARYPELGKNTDDIAEEILTSMLGLETQREALEVANKGILKRILDTFKGWFNNMFGVKDKNYELDFDSSLASIMQGIGTQLLYGPRSILNDVSTNEKSYLSKIMNKTLSEKETIALLEDRGFIVQVC